MPIDYLNKIGNDLDSYIRKYCLTTKKLRDYKILPVQVHVIFIMKRVTLATRWINNIKMGWAYNMRGSITQPLRNEEIGNTTDKTLPYLRHDSKEMTEIQFTTEVCSCCREPGPAFK